MHLSIPGACPEAEELEADGNRALRPPIKTGLKIPGLPGTGLEPFRFAAPRGRLWTPRLVLEEAEAATGEPRSMPRAFLRANILHRPTSNFCLGG